MSTRQRMMKVMSGLMVVIITVSFEAMASGAPIVPTTIEQLERLRSIPFTIEDISSASLKEERNRPPDIKEYQVLIVKQQEKEVLLVAEKHGFTKPQSQLVKKPIFGVIISNSKAARPQSGLARASLVYEFKVEGGITRYLALFSDLPVKVGPIRSAREYSAILALENNIIFVYGSANRYVLQKINELEWNFSHINALSPKKPDSYSFWRGRARQAPHNLYVNLTTLSEGEASGRSVVKPLYLDRNGTPTSVVSLEYNPNHRIKYIYEPGTKTYRRYFNEQIQKDASGEIIKVRNIIIQHVLHTIGNRGIHELTLIGEGRIDFYSQGYHFKGTWKKECLKTSTRFYFLDGQEINLPYGQTWIQIVKTIKGSK